MKFHQQLRNISLFYVIAVFQRAHGVQEDLRPCRKVVIQEEVALNISAMIVNTIPWMRIIDGYPFLFKNPKSKASALICLPEKVASSTWKSFFIKVKSKFTIEPWKPKL